MNQNFQTQNVNTSFTTPVNDRKRKYPEQTPELPMPKDMKISENDRVSDRCETVEFYIDTTENESDGGSRESKFECLQV